MAHIEKPRFMCRGFLLQSGVVNDVVLVFVGFCLLTCYGQRFGAFYRSSRII
jgi:hypothetical protein